MRFYKPHTQFYCGIDLHAKTMYLCIMDREKDILVHTNIRNERRTFLRLIKRFRDDVVVTVECNYNWYWLADLCHEHKIEFVLGHALYMKAIHGAKTKNDRIDSEKIARLTSGGLLPMAYVYPKKNRAIRDLLRRRLRFVRLRAELYGHIKTLNYQLNLEAIGRAAKCKTERECLVGRFKEPGMRYSVEADLEMIEHYDAVIASLEKQIRKVARNRFPRELATLQSIPGIGPIISWTILFELDSIDRFETRQQFSSYCRLVKPRRESGGKQYGTKGSKIGNPYLKWAFSEAAVHAARVDPKIEKYLHRLEGKHGFARARSLLAHKLGRAVYHMLRTKNVFDEECFLRN